MSDAVPPGGWVRRHGFALGVLVLAGLLIAVSAPRWWPQGRLGVLERPATRTPPPDPSADPRGHMQAARAAEIRQRFDQAVVMLHAKQYEHAATALERVVRLSPRMPEAHVNLGFAWLGLQRAEAAEAAFQRAIDLKTDQANAYFGLALAHEMHGDLESALGAMRSYLHLSRADEPFRARARAALWEWEQRLGRLPPSPEGSTIPNFGKR